jgi:hypothetical protein
MSGHRIPNDATRVDTNHEDEVRYWCERFRCSPDQLREAVSAVGQDVDSVRQHLSQSSV